MIGHNSEPLLRQQFLLISKEGKNHFNLIISEISRYRIEISQDSCHRPKTTSIQYQQQNYVKLWRINEKRH